MTVLGGIALKRRTKLVSLLTGLAATAAAMIGVPAFAADAAPSNFVLISNRATAKHNITLIETDQAGRLVRNGRWDVGAKQAHFWVLNPGDVVKVQGQHNFNQTYAATDLPVCLRISVEGDMHKVPGQCTTSGASETPWR
jgi:hypothetical protein